MPALDQIQTIVVVIMENRSFDHMLGYLSVPGPNRIAVDGLGDQAWLAAHANRDANGTAYPVFRLDTQSIIDPPHEQLTIAYQIGAPVNGVYPMNGFVQSYASIRAQNPTLQPGLVMGYYDAATLPVFDFFARQYTVCDRWFAALPTGTQANRLMAMSGETSIIDNAPFLLPDQDLVYDWLTQHKVSWCAYQSGDFLPFFTLMPRWQGEIAAALAADAVSQYIHPRFRRYSSFKDDWAGTAPMPQVIFIEPEYTDGPHAAPNDDHSPTGVVPGQQFLADIYNTLIANPQRWASTLLIVTYDEHGGFYDHVSPLPIVTENPALHPGPLFVSTGVRVPGLLISPFAEPGSVYHGPLDHTSILQLLAEKFDSAKTYSPAVSRRQPQLSPLSAALTRETARSDRPPAPPAPAVAAAVPVGTISTGAQANAQAFQLAATKLVQDHPGVAAGWPQWATLAATAAGA